MSEVYEDFPILYFAIRKGRHSTGIVCNDWDEAKHEVHNFPGSEYIATPTLIQARNYVHRLGEFSAVPVHFGYSNTIDGTTVSTSPDEQSSLETKRKRTKGDAIASNEGANKNKKNGRKIDESSTSLSQSYDNFSSVSASVNVNYDLSGMLPPSSRRSRDTKNSKDNLSTKEISNEFKKAEKKPSKLRRLLFEYYKRFNPHSGAKSKGKITIEDFLKKRNMFERKFEAFTSHWNRSGLLTFKCENLSPEKAIMRYDMWLMDKKKEKNETLQLRNEFDDGDSNDGDDDDSSITTPGGGKPKRQKQRKRKFESPPVMFSRPSSNLCGSRNDEEEPENEKESSPPFSKKSRKKGNASSTMKSNGCVVSNESDVDEDWDEMYVVLRKFYDDNNHCQVTTENNRFITTKNGEKKDLKFWVACQKERTAPVKEKTINNSVRNLTFREESLLNELNFIPNFKATEKKLKRWIGKKVAKCFNVTNGDDNSKTRRKKVFFGVVERISSISNEWVRVVFDDGDKEDFDCKGLEEGISLFKKYEDQENAHHNVFLSK